MSANDVSPEQGAVSTGADSTAGPDVDAIMARIKAEVKAELGDVRARFPRPAAAAMNTSDHSTSPVLYAEELDFMNAEWRGWPVRPKITTHRKYIGAAFVRVKEYLVHLVWDIMFKDYFQREERFHRQLVRYLNKNARYIDARDAEVFWQLVQKVDSDISAINDKCDRLHDEVFASLSMIEERLNRESTETNARRVGESS